MGKTSRNIFLLLGVTAGAGIAAYLATNRKRISTDDIQKNFTTVKNKVVKNVGDRLSKIGDKDSMLFL